MIKTIDKTVEVRKVQTRPVPELGAERRACFLRWFDQEPGKCWLWKGRMNMRGYGIYAIRVDKEPYPFTAHRVAFTVFKGPIPEGMFVLHACDNRPCVNPDHLRLGNHEDNMRDMVSRGRSLAGSRNPMNTRPERRLKGDQHWSRSKPERYARAERNGANTHPERLPRGEGHGMAKLTAATVCEIRRLGRNGLPQRQIALQVSVTQSTVGRILARKTWAHLED